MSGFVNKAKKVQTANIGGRILVITESGCDGQRVTISPTGMVITYLIQEWDEAVLWKKHTQVAHAINDMFKEIEAILELKKGCE